MSEPRDPAARSGAAPDDPAPYQVPRETTPAWESELLLSIGLVVALLQLPQFLDAKFFALQPRLPEPWLMLLVYVYLYAKVGAFGLATTFIVHLLARGFWVAMMGLRSVFPGGVHWEGLRLGPVGLRQMRREVRPLPLMIEKVDNFASGVFAFGFILLANALMISVATIVLVGIATAVSQGLLGGQHQSKLMLAMVLMLMVPVSLAAFYDRRRGATLPPDGRVARLLEFLFDVGRRVFAPRFIQSMVMVFNSQLGPRRATTLLVVTLYGLIGITTVDVLSRRGTFDEIGMGYLPMKGPDVLDRAHYADQRGTDLRSSVRPFVQSDVVQGPYVRLFVPYPPRQATPTLQAACPTLAMEADEDPGRERARRTAVLACLATVLAPTLDGVPITEVPFDFASDPNGGLPGIVAYLPATTLASGRHELTIRRFRKPGEGELEPGDDGLHRIVFWR